MIFLATHVAADGVCAGVRGEAWGPARSRGGGGGAPPRFRARGFESRRLGAVKARGRRGVAWRGGRGAGKGNINAAPNETVAHDIAGVVSEILIDAFGQVPPALRCAALAPLVCGTYLDGGRAGGRTTSGCASTRTRSPPPSAPSPTPLSHPHPPTPPPPIAFRRPPAAAAAVRLRGTRRRAAAC